MTFSSLLTKAFPHWEEQAEWDGQAACADADVDLFFPENGQSDRQAMLMCFRCPVRRECLQLALERPERLGIWGGSTAAMRSALRRLKLSPAETLEKAMEITEDSAQRRRLVA